MKNVITEMNITENVSLITLSQVENRHGILASIFGAISAAGIDVDMISQSYPAKETVELSFTVSDDQLPKLLTFLSSHKELRASVFSGNTKISFFGKGMENTPGVAAYVFGLFAKAECDIKMVNTSTCDISCLIAPEYTAKIKELFNE
ncbi:MAG: ACT domain-containing protein [Clostridia bacterium]|nr:ACT domain-containing protein [Clostridia bacterium]MBR2327906.1 ACT domain-containing protein [Clostridia bacterium]